MIYNAKARTVDAIPADEALTLLNPEGPPNPGGLPEWAQGGVSSFAIEWSGTGAIYVYHDETRFRAPPGSMIVKHFDGRLEVMGAEAFDEMYELAP